MKFRTGLLALLGCTAALAAPAPIYFPAYYSATSAGPNSALTLYANINVASADVGKTGNLYVAAFLPGNQAFVLTASGWQPYDGKTVPPAQTNVLLGNNNVQVLNGTLDVSGLAGATIYAGYGTSQADLLSNYKYGAVFTIGTSAARKVTLQALTNQPPSDLAGGAFAFLMTDGSVIVQSANYYGEFFKLTPDINGSYVNGSWSQIASLPDAYQPSAYASAVLADGRLLIMGGEYNAAGASSTAPAFTLTNMGAVYDPKANTWTMIAAPDGFDHVGDSPGVVMPDGTFLLGDKLTQAMASFNPATMNWTTLNTSGKNDFFAEESLTLLPSGNVLTVDVRNVSNSELYIPSLQQWVSQGNTPLPLAAPDVDYGGNLSYPSGIVTQDVGAQTVGGISYAEQPSVNYLPPGEIGPAILMPDGTVFYSGANKYTPDNPRYMTTAHTAIYHPANSPTATGTWTAGPDFPGFDSGGDTSAALLTNGNVLLSSDFGNLYEYTGQGLELTGTNATQGGIFFLPLPNGQQLMIGSGTVYVYASAGAPQPSWAPTVTSVANTLARTGSYRLSGTQLNGLSQAVCFGDEYQNATNYPLVRITNKATGHVFYARTHDHSSMGVATGSATVSTYFDVPANAEPGASTLVVVANGIASNPQNVTIQ